MPERAWVGTDGQTDRWTNKSPPVFCKTLSPLGPASSHSNSQSCKAGKAESLTTYCPWATCFYIFAVCALTAPAQILKWPQMKPLPSCMRACNFKHLDSLGESLRHQNCDWHVGNAHPVYCLPMGVAHRTDRISEYRLTKSKRSCIQYKNKEICWLKSKSSYWN